MKWGERYLNPRARSARPSGSTVCSALRVLKKFHEYRVHVHLQLAHASLGG
jgi:hypothetical protein